MNTARQTANNSGQEKHNNKEKKQQKKEKQQHPTLAKRYNKKPLMCTQMTMGVTYEVSRLVSHLVCQFVGPSFCVFIYFVIRL